MNRRNVLKSIASITAGAGVVAARDSKPRASAKTAGPFIETSDGTQLYHKDWGPRDSGKARTVVFINSWALSSDMWQYQMLHLAEQGLRCVAYDKRGHGRSSDPGHGWDYDTLSDDLAAVIEQLGLREVTLVGHSMAGGEMVRYLSRHGAKRISRLVFLAATTPGITRTADNPGGLDPKVAEQLRAVWTSDFPKWLADNAAPFGVSGTSPEILRWCMNIMMQASLKGLVDYNRAGVEADFREEMRKISLPTLVIHGDKDVSAPLELCGRRTAQLIAGSQLRIYQGAPHGLFLTHMDRVNSDLSTFIKG